MMGRPTRQPRPDPISPYTRFCRLAVLRPRVPEAVRRDCARAIARNGRFAPLVALYANDVPAVSAIMLREVRLAEADWLALLPATSAMARSVLAGRSDLPQKIGRASRRDRVCQYV